MFWNSSNVMIPIINFVLKLLYVRKAIEILYCCQNKTHLFNRSKFKSEKHSTKTCENTNKCTWWGDKNHLVPKRKMCPSKCNLCALKLKFWIEMDSNHKKFYICCFSFVALTIDFQMTFKNWTTIGNKEKCACN